MKNGERLSLLKSRQALKMARSAHAYVRGSSVFIRELMPQDLKFDFDTMARDEAADVAKYLATVVGKAHAHQMDAAERKAWLRALASSRSKSLDAPSWLWQSVVSLIASHETAYLEHCRRYALTA